MKRTFLDLEKTTDTTANPDSGDMRLLVDNNGDPILRTEAGVSTPMSMQGHVHTDYSPTSHNHDGVYSPVGHTHPPTLEDLGTVNTALSVDLDGADYQEVNFSGATSINAVNAAVDTVKEVGLYMTSSVISLLTFPATWDWDTKPTTDQLTVNPGETVYLKLRTISNTITHAYYRLLET